MYHDPDSGNPINVGVQTWLEYKNTLDFVTRMGVSSNGSMQFTPLTTKYVDFQSGKPVEGYAAPENSDRVSALHKYLELCEKYEDYLLPSFDQFPAPDAIPEDLLMPFGQFVEKYGIAAAVPQMWQATVQGLGDFLEIPTMYTMQAMGVPMARALLGKARAVVPPSGALYELYGRIADFLGDDVFYSSTVVSATRDGEHGVSVVVRGSGNLSTEIQAKRLLIAIEPTAENMSPFLLDDAETDVFDRFGYFTVYAGILRHPSLEPSTSYSNVVPVTPTNYTIFPSPPQLGRMDYLGGTKDLFSFTAVGTEKDTPDTMKALIRGAIDKLIATGVVKGSSGELTFPAFADHGKMHSWFSVDDVRGGYVQKQMALQGRKSTWYTGAAFGSPYSTALWAYNDELLPKLIKGI